MTLIWSPESIHDLIALRAHIAEHDPAAAKRVALHILYCVEYLLSENPKLGAPGRVPGTRELVIPKRPTSSPTACAPPKSRSHASTTPRAAGPTACSALRAMTNRLRYRHAAAALNLINVLN
jgi:toxin ParE1/3/4